MGGTISTEVESPVNHVPRKESKPAAFRQATNEDFTRSSLEEAKVLLDKANIKDRMPLRSPYADLIDVVSRTKPEVAACLVKLARR